VLGSLRQTQSLPEVNAVATVILVVSIPLIAISAYLMRDEQASTRVVQGE
jgi:ABC-type spermidine/putrescine transport system permease subunit II